MKAENRKALTTRICPRCGKPLYARGVFNDWGTVAKDGFELYCLAGHTYQFSISRKEQENAEDQRQ